MSRTYDGVLHCEECGKLTDHTCHDAEHERDSSGDWSECKVCGTRKDGWGQTLQHSRPSYKKANGIKE